MELRKNILTAIVVVSMSNFAWAQWSSVTSTTAPIENGIYNTSWNATSPGKVCIGSGSPDFDTPAFPNPYGVSPGNTTAVLQVKRATGNQPSYPGFQPVPFFTISATDITPNLQFGIAGSGYGGFIRANGSPLNVECTSMALLSGPAGVGSGGNLRVTGSETITGTLTIGSVTTNANYKLFVQTGILTEKVKVAVSTTSNWSDYVFNKDYKLLSLGEVETYIKKNKHLPGVPSAEEVVKDGIDMATMDAKLLEKIEELTLYMIEMKKENSDLKQRIKVLESR
jgi:hypothetical protein